MQRIAAMNGMLAALLTFHFVIRVGFRRIDDSALYGRTSRYDTHYRAMCQALPRIPAYALFFGVECRDLERS
jgi:hypothetical protein